MFFEELGHSSGDLDLGKGGVGEELTEAEPEGFGDGVVVVFVFGERGEGDGGLGHLGLLFDVPLYLNRCRTFVKGKVENGLEGGVFDLAVLDEGRVSESALIESKLVGAVPATERFSVGCSRAHFLMSMTVLYRPVGLAELALMFDTQMRAFPPRLLEQPIFYPVLNRDYAIQIARDWNAPSEQSGFSGFVTEFNVGRDYLEQFPVRTVGSSIHQELWVPAECVGEFNREIQDVIRITDAFFSDSYTGFIPTQFGLARKTAIEQLVCMAATFDYSSMDFVCEVAANHKAIYLNFPFWLSGDFGCHGVSLQKRDRVLDAIRALWQPRFAQTPLYEPQATRPNA